MAEHLRTVLLERALGPSVRTAGRQAAEPTAALARLAALHRHGEVPVEILLRDDVDGHDKDGPSSQPPFG